MQNVVVLFNAPDFTEQNYDQAWDDLRAAGHAHPKGLLSHVGYPNPGGGFAVVDVWESAEAFQAFGNVLMPIIQKSGGTVPPPQVIPARYFLAGQAENVPA